MRSRRRVPDARSWVDRLRALIAPAAACVFPPTRNRIAEPPHLSHTHAHAHLNACPSPCLTERNQILAPDETSIEAVGAHTVICMRANVAGWIPPATPVMRAASRKSHPTRLDRAKRTTRRKIEFSACTLLYSTCALQGKDIRVYAHVPAT